MDKNKDPMDQIIVEDLLHEADKIDKEIARADMPKMPEDVKARIKAKLDGQIEQLEKEKIYEKLSEEDRKALELGRQMLEREELVVYRKKKRRVFLAVAAVAILVLAMGVTSMGGPERVVEKIKVLIEDREIVRVETAEDNYINTPENEEKAYQKIKDVFGVEPVKPQYWPNGTAFVNAEIDEVLQTAQLLYECDGEVISYYISSQYTDSSWGMDIEDELKDRYCIERGTVQIEIMEYLPPESEMKLYSAKYTYNSLNYFLVGSMKQSDFDILIKNLTFLSN